MYHFWRVNSWYAKLPTYYYLLKWYTFLVKQTFLKKIKRFDTLNFKNVHIESALILIKLDPFNFCDSWSSRCMCNGIMLLFRHADVSVKCIVPVLVCSAVFCNICSFVMFGVGAIGVNCLHIVVVYWSDIGLIVDVVFLKIM